jgi:hypothetical protein
MGFIIWMSSVFASFLASVFCFWIVVTLLTFIEVTNLADDKGRERLGWVWGCTIVTLILLYFRFKPTPIHLLYTFASWVWTGVVYSIIRWVWQCKEIRRNLESEFAKIKAWPAGDKIQLRYNELLNDTTYRRASWEKADALNYFRPNFSNLGGRVTLWVMLWPVFMLRDVTIDLIQNIQKMLSGLYQSISNKIFGV